MRGLDDRGLRRARDRGELVRLHAGAYLAAADWARLDYEQQYRARSIAVGLASRTRPILSHASAAVLHGVPLLGRGDRPVHVLATIAAGTRTEGDVRRHATAHSDIQIEEIAGVRCTGLARSLVEYAADSTFAAGVVALDWALRARPVECAPERLTVVADALGFSRGRQRFDRALGFADARSESVGEWLSRAAIHELGFPAPILQQEFRDHSGLIGYTDFWWPEVAVFGEFDGVGKYIREEYTRGRSTAEVVIAEKVREDRIRATGPTGVRWGWEDAMSPRRLHARLSGAGLHSRARSIVHYL